MKGELQAEIRSAERQIQESKRSLKALEQEGDSRLKKLIAKEETA